MHTFLPCILITFLLVLAAIAFFTLLERKVLGYAQLRKGPNKVGILGLPQPMADAAKLFTKEISRPTLSNTIPFIAAPFLGLLLALAMWTIYPTASPANFIKFGILFFLCISRLNVYSTLAAGWTSNSKYSLLGALRRVAQTISYEVSISLTLLSALILLNSFDTQEIFDFPKSSLLTLLPLLFYIWFTTTLAETNRTPFDFAEGERELVSGFNTEYAGGTFALIFMAEYTNIIFMSLISTLIFLRGHGTPYIELANLIVGTLLLCFLFVWVRGTLPRIRYDRLIRLTWKAFLPLSLIFLIGVSQILWLGARQNGLYWCYKIWALTP